MKKKSGSRDGHGSKQEPEWSVYVVRCADGSLYTGITKDIFGRLDKHNSGKGAAYTRSRRPVTLFHREDGLTRSQALVREAQIKRFPRPQKEALGGGGRTSSRKGRNRRLD